MNCLDRYDRHFVSRRLPHLGLLPRPGRSWGLPGGLALLVAMLTACNGPAPDSAEPPVPAESQHADPEAGNPRQRTNSDELEGGASDQQHGSVEFWAACFIGGSQVGYTHLTTQRVSIDGDWHVSYRYQDELRMKRFQDMTVVRSHLECLETAAGDLVRFRTQVDTGPSGMVTEGFVDQGTLRMELQTAGRTEQQEIPWQTGWGGFFADHRSLRARPMKPRETRRLKALLPILHQVGEIHLEAAGYESVPMLEGTRQLLRIDMTTIVGPTRLRSIIWCDDDGIVWKTRDLQLDLESFRCDRETALRPVSGSGFDLGGSTIVQVPEPLAAPHRTTQAVYLARLPDGAIAQTFLQDGSQSLHVVDNETAQLTVEAIRPERPQQFPAAAWTEPTEADRQSTAMIQSDDARIVRMAAEVAPQETDPWRLACELERYVKRTVQLKNYSTAMATAAEVAESLEGDCTEHAMLLAALCRARQIPARVAIGLVYHPPAQGFAYHMWTEVWIRDRWIGLDATLGQGGIGAAHLKLAVSSMEGSSAFADMLPIVQVIGRLELRIVSVERS